tara:strand:- start:125 stop:781 length:657 start_codon:yes stop_codon:yes gene_type:complete
MDSELKNSILKTGTSLIGIVCKDGIIMASDRQTTAGEKVVMHKNTRKTVKINDYISYSGCGLAAAIRRTAKLLAAELRLKQLKSKKRATVKETASLLANMVYSNIRQPSMVPDEMGALIGGVNENGTTELYSIDPAGNVTFIEDYDASLGSGMPYILGLLERQYKEEITIKEGAELAIEALKSSMQRDTGSGYGIDVFAITKDGIKQIVEQKITSEYK